MYYDFWYNLFGIAPRTWDIVIVAGGKNQHEGESTASENAVNNMNGQLLRHFLLVTCRPSKSTD